MCEYCEGVSAPVSFPEKILYDNGETQNVQDGFRINLEERKLETFIKDCGTEEHHIVFSRDIDYCPFCGISLDEMEKILKNKELYQYSTGREAAIYFCENVKTHDIEYLDNVLNNLRILKNNKPLVDLQGCPHNYGLEYYEGLCHSADTENMSSQEKTKMCIECWKKALE